MSLKEYLKDKILFLLLQFACMFLLILFLRLTGYPLDLSAVILISWILLLCIWMAVQYYSRRQYFKKAERIIDNLDQRYLLGELMPQSFRLEDRLYQALIRKSNKSVIERIHFIEQEQKDYREYIESWVHEIKAPITAIALNCENHLDERSRYVLIENQKIENCVDMALYYARSDAVYKDYRIKKTDLQQVAEKVLIKNKQYLIQNHICAEVICPNSAYTDEKWMEFILNQLIQNSVKYRKERGSYICITTQDQKNGTLLRIKDDGIGILPEEISYIFEKGFTGTNGRLKNRSTGMGLYLCKKLCDKLGIGIRAVSQPGYGTEIIMEFPESVYLADYRK